MQQVFDGNVQPFEPIGEPIVHAKGYGLKMMRRRFRRPDGKEDDFDYLTGRTGVTIFAVTGDGLIVLKEEFKQGACRICLEAASGILEEEELLRTTAERELREETGFEPGQLIVLPERCVFGERKFPFGYRIVLATNCRQVGEPTPDPGEAAFNVYVATSEEFWNAVDSGRIRACQTIHAAYAAVVMGFISLNQNLPHTT